MELPEGVQAEMTICTRCSHEWKDHCQTYGGEHTCIGGEWCEACGCEGFTTKEPEPVEPAKGDALWVSQVWDEEVMKAIDPHPSSIRGLLRDTDWVSQVRK